MKMGYFIFFVGVLWFSANIAYSHEYHHGIVIDESSTITNNYVQQGVALSDAFAQIDCNFSSVKWHGGVGFGINEENFAQAGGICKRYKRTLIKATIGREGDKSRGGIGIMFQLE